MTGKLAGGRLAAGGLASAILESAHALVVTLDLDGRITGFNRACELLTGYNADEVVGTPIWDRLLPEESIEPIKAFFASLSSGGEIPEEYENAWVTRDGRMPTIAWNNSVIRGASGEIELVVGIGIDITERKIAADRLARAQRIAGIGSWEYSPDTGLEQWSDQFYINLGLEPGSIEPKVEEFYRRVHPGDREWLKRRILDSLETKEPYSADFRIIRPDGAERLIHEEAEIVLDAEGKVVALAGTMQDVTALRETEARLQTLTRSFADAERVAGMGHWEWSAETNEEYWSEQGFRNLGLEPDSVAPGPEELLKRLHPDDRGPLREKVENALKTGTGYVTDYRVITPDGALRLIREEARAVRNNRGEVSGLSGVTQDITERHKAERALADTADRLAAAVDLAQLGSWELDPETNILTMSPETAIACGLPPETGEIDNDEITALIPEDDQARVTRLMERAISLGEAYTHEHTLLRPDGTVRRLLEHAKPVRDEVTGKVRLIGTIQDITDRYLAQHQLSQTARRLDAAMLMTGLGSWEWDPETNLLWNSEHTLKICGLGPEHTEVGNDFLMAMIPPEEHESVLGNMNRALTHGETYTNEYHIVRPDGDKRTILEHGEPFHDEVSGKTVLLGTIQDVTEQRRAERRLARTAEALNNAQRIARIGSWERDVRSGNVRWSDQNFRVYGLEPGAIEPRSDTWSSYVHPDDLERVTRLHGEAMAEGRAFELDFRTVGADGITRWVHASGEPELDENGAMTRVSGTLQDITERKQSEDELALALKRLHDAQTAARIGNWEWDAETDRDWWSEQQFRNYGVEATEGYVPGDYFLKFAHPDDRDMAKKAVEQSASGGAPLDMEFRTIGADGVERILWVSGNFERSADGRILRMMGTTQDITARKLAEQELVNTTRRLEDAQRIAMIGDWFWDLRDNSEQWSAQSYAIFGVEPGEVAVDGDTYLRFIHPDDLERVRQAHEQAIANKTAISVEYRCIDGRGIEKYLQTTGECRFDRGGRLVAMAGTVQDVSKSKRTEAELARSAARLEDAHRVANLGHWEWRPDTVQTVWSDQLFRIFGMELGEIEPTHATFFKMVHPDDRELISKTMAQTMETGESYEIEFRIFRTDGAMRHIFERAQRYFDDETGKPSIRGVMQDITARKEAELSLHDTTVRLAEAQRLAQVGSWNWDPEENVIRGSDQYYRIFGLEPGSVTFDGFGFLQHVHPDDRERVMKVERASTISRKPFSVEYRVVNPDGAERVVLEQGEWVKGDGSRKPLWRGVLQDVTEQRKAEDAIRTSERYLDLFFKHSLTSFVLMDRDFNFIRVNEAYASADGKETSFFAGKNHFDIYPSEARALFERVRDSGKPFHAEAMAFDYAEHPERGTTWWDWSLVPIANDKGVTELLVLSLNEVTERVKAEQALRDSEARLDAFFSKAPVGLAILDNDYRYVKINDTLAQMNGASIEAHVGKQPSDVMIPEKAALVEGLLRRTLEHGEPINREENAVPGPDGREHYRVYTQFPIAGDPAKPDRVGVIIVDITELKAVQQELARLNVELEQRVEERTAELRAAQSELVKSERLATLGQLTATVSHELRNPLGAMRTSMYVVERKMESEDERLHAAIARVNRNITRCDQIIDELLDYTRIRDLELYPVDIDRWLASVLDEQPTPEGVAVDRRFGAKGVRVRIDSDRLRRAIINIYENACHAVTGAHDANDVPQNPTISVATKRGKGWAKISFADNGPGIAPENRGKILEPLFSTKNFGVGLGLPTVKQIVEQHGGRLEIRDNPEGGAIFALRLPLEGT